MSWYGATFNVTRLGGGVVSTTRRIGRACWLWLLVDRLLLKIVPLGMVVELVWPGLFQGLVLHVRYIQIGDQSRPLP